MKGIDVLVRDVSKSGFGQFLDDLRGWNTAAGRRGFPVLLILLVDDGDGIARTQHPPAVRQQGFGGVELVMDLRHHDNIG